jgi:hypothetical protein
VFQHPAHHAFSGTDISCQANDVFAGPLTHNRSSDGFAHLLPNGMRNNELTTDFPTFCDFHFSLAREECQIVEKSQIKTAQFLSFS